MNTDKLIKRLGRIVGPSHVSASAPDRELYSYDASHARGFPDAIVFPGSALETARVVRTVRDAGIPFVPRGFGTNLSGGTVLPAGGVVLGLTRLNRICSIQPENRCAVVQPGVTNLELQNALSPKGFFFAPDPASQKAATLGGNLAENSGGPHCLKYGVTTNHILGMEVVLPNGEVVRMGGATLDSPGYDLRGVMVGSEGTLGIATEIIVRILPKPESTITMLAVYDSISDAAQSVSDIISSGITPATLEMMDTPVIGAVEDSYACGYPRDAAAVLIIEVEGPKPGLKEQAGRIRDICNQNGCRDINKAQDENQRNRLWEGRRGAFGAIARISPYIINDCTVPRSRLPEALAGVAEIAGRHGFHHGNVFHAGDGNLHPLVFFDDRDPQQLRRAKQAGWEIMETCVGLGGTITGEHGVGVEKRAAMSLMFSEEDLDIQRSLHHVFDPEDLLNPGKIIPDLPQTDQEQAAPDLLIPDDTLESRHIREEKLIRKVLETIEENHPLTPTGSGHHEDFGNLLNPSVSHLNSSGLTDIIKFDSANHVVIVGAGMSLDYLQGHLADNHQWLPIRPHFPRKGYSVGSLIALGACGPERGFYGAPRDLLLGLRFIDGKGRTIKAGGEVVKNVAGYDMTRLLTGSMGTLGFITEATFRISTLPEKCVTISAAGPLDSCISVAAELMQSTLEPVFIVAVSKDLSGLENTGSNWRVAIGFEGFPRAVTYQMDRASTLLKTQGFEDLDETPYMPREGIFHSHYDRLDQQTVVLRTDIPFDQTKIILGKMGIDESSRDVLVDFGCGRILTAWDGMEDDFWEDICKWSTNSGGNSLIEKAPRAFKEKWDVFGLPRPEWEIAHRVKKALDPHNVFSPGRLPGRI